MIRSFQQGVGGSSFEINATKEVLLAPFDVKKGDVFYRLRGWLLTKLANPSTLPTGVARGVAFSPDGSKLVMAQDDSPYIMIYGVSGNTFTKLPDPSTLPTPPVNSCAFSPDGSKLAIAQNLSPYIMVYSVSGNTFTRLPDPSTPPTYSTYGCAFSPDGSKLVMAQGISPYIAVYIGGFAYSYTPPGTIANGARVMISTQDASMDSEIEAYTIPVIK
jgi:WD40 repeat protein